MSIINYSKLAQVFYHGSKTPGLSKLCPSPEPGTNLTSFKLASLSTNKLRSVLNGQEPLFHMVNNANIAGFNKSKQLVSPAEAAARGWLSNFEGSWGSVRHSANGVDAPLSITANSASVPFSAIKNKASNTLMPAHTLARYSTPGVVGEYFTALDLPSYAHAKEVGKNWNSISFSYKPLRAYGDVGIMTTPRYMRGSLASTSPYAGAEQQLGPTRVFDSNGVLDGLELPRARGTQVYVPDAVSREEALALKQRGALPLNSRLFRKLKWLKKNELRPTRGISLEDGNQAGIDDSLKLMSANKLGVPLDFFNLR